MQSFADSSTWLAAVLSPEILITSLSHGAEQFTGYSAQELLGRPITKILADSSAFEMPRVLNAIREWGYWEGDIVYRARSGKLVEASGMLSSQAGSGSDSPGYLLVSSLRKSLVLDECERSAVAQIAANLRGFAHDLNNPLAVMMGFAQLLILNADCRGGIRSDIEKVYSELKRVTQVVERLHRYALSLHDKPQQDQASLAVRR